MEVVIGCIVLVAALIKVIIDQFAYEEKKREEAYLKKLTPQQRMEYEERQAYLKKLEEEEKAYLKKLEEDISKRQTYSEIDILDAREEYFQAKREQLEQLGQQELETIREVARQNAIKEFRQEQPKKVPPPLPIPSKEKEEKWYKEGTRWADVYSEGTRWANSYSIK